MKLRTLNVNDIFEKVTTLALLTLLTLLQTKSVQAEIYRWIDENGYLQISDRAPKHLQAEAINLDTLSGYTSDNRADSPAQASLAGPDKHVQQQKVSVILYSTQWCGYCKKARHHFKDNNIKFKEYDIERTPRGKKDYKQLEGTGVPIILVNDRRLDGFSEQRFQQTFAYEQSL